MSIITVGTAIFTGHTKWICVITWGRRAYLNTLLCWRIFV